MQLLEHAEGIGAVIDRARLQVDVFEHQTAPCPGDQLLRDLVGADALATDQLGQLADRIEDVLPWLNRAEGDDLAQHRQKGPDGGIALDQLGSPDVVAPGGIEPPTTRL